MPLYSVSRKYRTSALLERRTIVGRQRPVLSAALICKPPLASALLILPAQLAAELLVALRLARRHCVYPRGSDLYRERHNIDRGAGNGPHDAAGKRKRHERQEQLLHST